MQQLLEHIQIQKIGAGGIGISTMPNGKKILISGPVLPNTTVSCLVIKKKKDYIEARLEKIEERDPAISYATPPCKHYAHGCGGCKWQYLPYEEQLNVKTKLILDSFRGHEDILAQTTLYPITKSPQEYFYRNKIEFSFGKYMQGMGKREEEGGDVGAHNIRPVENQQWNCGFHQQGLFSKVIDVEQCFLVSPAMHEIFVYIKKMCKESGLPVHDQKTHEGFFRHLVLREGVNTKQLLVNLVVAGQQLSSQHAEEQRAKIQKDFRTDPFLQEHVTTFCVTTNNGLADVVKGQDIQTDVLRGEGYIHETLLFSQTVSEATGSAMTDKKEFVVEEGQMKEITSQESTAVYSERQITKEISFRVSPFSFFQTNTKGAELLFATAQTMIGQIRGTILDLYCGTGSIGLSFLRLGIGNFCIGIEIVEEAIRDAQKNAVINGYEKQTYFVAGKAEALVFADAEVQQKMQDIGLIIVDPPRDGMHKNVIKFLCDIKRQHQCKLLYISCNPITMARDLALLATGGRRCTGLTPVDMFPQTQHIEMIGVLV